MKDLLTETANRASRYLSEIGNRRVAPLPDQVSGLEALGGPLPEGPSDPAETLALLDVPGLGAFGVRPDQADAIVAQAARSSSMQGNPVPLSTGALRAALLAAI